MGQERFAYLFHQYVYKKCSPQELDELMEMLRDEEQSYNLEFLLDSIWESSPEVDLEKNKAEDILAQVFVAGTAPGMAPVGPVLTAATEQQSRKIKFTRWLNWAAAIVILATAAVLLINPPKSEKQLAATPVEQPTPVAAPTPVIVVKTSNEHQKVTLPDGSTVVLNNNSSVSYPALFTAHKREVVLTGEGYFDIKHDSSKSFIVLTGKIKTTVLGTAFNIRAYEKDKAITVTVTRGKVSVLDDKAILSIALPNQQIVFNKTDQKHNVSKVLAKNSIQWQESDLFFDDISMEQAAQILAARFNTPIVFANNSVAKCRFTATFLKGEPLAEILKVICSYNNAQYEPAAGGITIKGSGCE